MVDKFLKPIDMEHLAKSFVENKVTGIVLLGLEVCTSIIVQSGAPSRAMMYLAITKCVNYS